MRNPSHLVNEDCSTIYVNVGSSNIVPLSVDPNETGLFGSSLSLNSRILVGDPPDHGFRFKASYRDDPHRMLSEGEPYDYTNDLEYRTKVKNLGIEYVDLRQEPTRITVRQGLVYTTDEEF